MTTTIIKNTNIRELMEIARGNFQVLEKMTEEFRRLVQQRPTKTASGKGPVPMTAKRAIALVSEIIRENRENGELEGVLNRNRVAALNRLLQIAKACSDSEEPTQTES
jgi:hypothetical protein